jgi:hypothetical protein
VALFFFANDSFQSNVWLNPFVFVGNVDSIINDLCMLAVCGATLRSICPGLESCCCCCCTEKDPGSQTTRDYARLEEKNAPSSGLMITLP